MKGMASLVNCINKFSFLHTLQCRSLHAVNTVKLSTSSSPSSSVDVGDIQRLANLADEWWDEQGPLQCLHTMNKPRLQFIVEGLVNTHCLSKAQSSEREPLQGIKLLDVGCGGGILTEPLARLGANAIGLDAGEAVIKVAQLHAKKDPTLANQLQYVYSTIEEHAENNREAYDVVVASEVIEHVMNRESFVRCCVTTLKPGGSIFFTTFNKTILSWFAGIILAEKILRIVPNRTHEWEKFVPPGELEHILNTCGCRTKVIHGMLLNPVTLQWSWTKSVPITYALHSVKRNS